MGKRHINLGVDDYLFECFKKLGGNASASLENLMRNYVEQKNSPDIDLLKLNKEIQDQRKTIIDEQLKFESLLSKRSAAEQRIKMFNDKDLKKQIKLGDAIKNSGIMEEGGF